MTRPPWDQYFLGLAETVATRATCDRKHVGAVLVRDFQYLSSGYNGSPRGLPHCDDVGHELKEMAGRASCVRTVHAEANAIAHAAKHGICVAEATCYSTAIPCYECCKLLINAGISRIVYREYYESRCGMSGDPVRELLAAAGIELEHCPCDTNQSTSDR